MLYRGFIIDRSVPMVIDRWNRDTHMVEHVVGFECEVFDQNDADRTECLDTFRLAVGFDIADISTENVDRAIRNYIDNHNVYLNLMRSESVADRKNAIIGKLASLFAVTLEPVELYDLLSRTVGMTDKEICDCGGLIA